MIIILQPLSGTPKAYLDRAKHEMERVLNFRGHVIDAKVVGKSIEVNIEINPAWDLPISQKVELLKQWIPAKVKKVFEVVNVE